MSKDLKMLGVLGIVLLGVMITFGVIILIGGEFKEQICEQEGGTYTTTCSALGEGYNATVEIQSQILTLVGWIGIFVLVAIGVVLLKMVRSFNSEKGQ